MKDFYRNLLQLINAGQPVAWATVIRSTGSTPQKTGSAALFDSSGLLSGTVGGGIMEAEVEKSAWTLLKSKSSNLFRYTLDRDQEGDGAICGGEAEVLIDGNPSIHQKALEEMEASLSQKKEGSLITLVSRQKRTGRAIHRYWNEGADRDPLSSNLPEQVVQIIREYDEKQPAGDWWLREIPESDDPVVELVFAERIRPFPQLIIAGAGHIGKALAHLGRLLDFEVTVIDYRPEYAHVSHLPDADHIVVNDIGEAMKGLDPGPDTYCVIVTHGHQHDGEALKPLIGSKAAYVGMIGSRHKVSVMKKEFIEKGWATPDQWDRIHAPIGLPIGSKTVQEIAFSIAAQLVQVRNINNQGNGK
jgi:xanthine dehydrogenase accessory factor